MPISRAPGHLPGPGRPPERAGPATPLQPVRLEHNWTTVSYEGVVAPAEEPPLQKFRRRTVEHVQWFDPARGIRMETMVPHEDVILIKADMQ